MPIGPAEITAIRLAGFCRLRSIQAIKAIHAMIGLSLRAIPDASAIAASVSRDAIASMTLARLKKRTITSIEPHISTNKVAKGLANQRRVASRDRYLGWPKRVDRL